MCNFTSLLKYISVLTLKNPLELELGSVGDDDVTQMHHQLFAQLAWHVVSAEGF